MATDSGSFQPLDIIRGGGKLEQLSALDASFVYGETTKGPMHIGSLNIYDPSTAPGGKVRFKDILTFVESRLHKAKSFKQKLQMVPMNLDHPYWVEDDDFDIEFHVRHIALPAPGDWRQLCILTARLHSRPLDLSRPPWEFWVIEGLDNIPNIPKGSYAIVSKVHHSAIDGVSGVEMAQATHTLTSDVKEISKPVDIRKTRKTNAIELLARAQINAVTKPFHSLKVARNLAPGALKFIGGVRRGEFNLFRNKIPRTRFNNTVSGHRVVGGHAFSLDAIKAIRKKVPGSTINDVMLSICGGALRNYLETKEGIPVESLVAMAPVSVRSEKEKGSMGNAVSALSVSLGTHLEDPLARLHYVHETTSQSKAVSNAIGARQLSDASQLAPAMVTGVAARLYTRLGMANRVSPIFNTVVSNVPGPQIPLYMNGARMVASYGLGPVMDSMGLFHAVTSYCGDIVVSFTADRKMMPDPDFYADCLWAAYEELYDVTVKKPAPRVRHRTHSKSGSGQPKTAAAKKAKPKTKSKSKPKSSSAPKIKTVTSATKKSAEKPKKPAVKPKPAPKPKAIKATRPVESIISSEDDLTKIKGIGPELTKVLNGAGITKFEQVARLSENDIEKIETALDFKGRIGRENWVAQAQSLLKTGTLSEAPSVH